MKIKWGSKVKWVSISSYFKCDVCQKEFTQGKHRVIKHHGQYACMDCVKEKKIYTPTHIDTVQAVEGVV